MSADGNNGLQGAKGGSSSQRTPVEAPDSLNSTAYAHILDLVSEGPIAGWYSANPLEDIFFDETPVANPDGSLNFTDVTMEFREGTQNQSYMKGFPNVASEVAIGVELKSIAPWVRTITRTECSAINVRLSVAALSKLNMANGDTLGHTVAYAIDLKVDAGAFVEVLQTAFTGKTTTKYERSHRIDLPPAATSWTVRVRRLTPDTEESNIQDMTAVESITEIIDLKFRYPNSAIVGVKLNAAQFRSIPNRAYRLLGLIVKVPSNYNPVTRVYTGVWNGTFQLAWTNNPAWIFYDLVTSKRYGTGEHVDAAMLDKYALYNIAQYCDELVSDGKGGTEPRFQCTVHFQRQEDAYKVIQDLASVFRGISYWGSGAIVPVADMPRDPVYTYTNANVRDGKFSYQGSARRARHTVALVSWSDPSDFGRQKVEYVEDEEGIARYGVQPVQINALGAQTQGQAQRVGRWLLLTERYETDTVTFGVGLDGGTLAMPGDVVRIADAKRAGKRMGGRVKASTASAITVDLLPTPAPVAGDSLIVAMPSGLTETRIISSVVGNTINVPAFSAAPVLGAIWAVETAALKTQLFTVISIGEGDGLSAVITGLQHEPGKFDAVDDGTFITPRVITGTIPQRQAPPENLVVSAAPRAGQVVANTVVTGKWDAAPGAVNYDVQWRRSNGEWSPILRVIGTQCEALDSFAGEYVLKVSARNALGVVSVPAVSATYTVTDQSMVPGYVGDLEADIANALGMAQDAMDAANAVTDGGIMSYFGPTAPSGLAAEDVGDLWFDSDDGNKIYRWSGSAWIAAPDSAIATAIAAAATAQATADGKVKTFAQFEPPSALGVGDLWIDTNDGNKLYRATAPGTGSWIQIQDTGIGAALAAAANAQATADGSIVSFWQATAPVIGAGAGQAAVGDIWFDTDDGNKIWRVVSGVWVDAQDDSLALALAAASTAQATADGKVKTYFQADEVAPVGMGLGDLWYKTTSGKLVRWNGSNWTSQVLVDVAALNASIANALTAANNAQATADGLIFSFWQTTAPTIGAGAGQASVGDIWFDIDDGNKIYRVVGGAWVVAQDDDMAAALLAATTAQATADGKVKTYFQNTAPVSGMTLGDLWFNDSTNKLSRWNGSNWTQTLVDVGGLNTSIANALAAANNAQATADGAVVSFWQTSAPTIGAGAGQATVGDIWFDTDDGNKIYRVVGGAWVLAADDDMAAAILAATTAQATADGKVKTFFAADASPPTASGVGDLWFRTTSKTLQRWNGSAWADIDATTGYLAGSGINQLWDEYTRFGATLPSLNNSAVTAAAVADADAIGGYALRLTTTDANTGAFTALAPVWSTSVNPITGQNYIVSFYARANVSGHLVGAELYEDGNSRGTSLNISINNTTGLTRYSAIIAANAVMVKGNLILRVNKSGVSGRIVHIDKVMVEPQVGTKTTPSAWVPGAAGRSAAAAAAAAASAQATADGVVDIYRQSNAPAFPPAKLGDYWQDSDDNKWYYSTNGSSWTEATDARIPQAISDAAAANTAAGAANTNANSRIRTYYASTTPTPSTVGDLWYNTATGVLARWDGSAWANTADNSIAALNPNVINPGFEQDFTGWADPWGNGWGGWFTEDPVGLDAPSGTKVMVKSGGTTGNTGLMNNAKVAVTPGSNVVCRLVAKATSTPAGGIEIGMAWYTAAGALISWSASTADIGYLYCNGAWKEFRKTIPAPGGAAYGKMFINVLGYVAGRWEFDSARADLLEEVTAGNNMIRNSDFIQGGTYFNGAFSIGTANESKHLIFASIADNAVVQVYPNDVLNDTAGSIGKQVSAQCEFLLTGAITSNTRCYLVLESIDAANAVVAFKYSTIYSNAVNVAWSPINTDLWTRLTVDGMVVPPTHQRFRATFVMVGTGTFWYRRPKLERGATATAYQPSIEITYGGELAYPGSKRRLGDQRNLMQSLVNGYGAVSDAVPLSANSSGNVTVNAFSVKMGGSSVSYSAVTNAVTGLTVGQAYSIYCFDAAFEGGTRTWYASNGTFASIMSLGDDIVVAGVVTIPASGSSSGGSGGGTPEDDPFCVHYDTVLPDGRLCRDLKVGDMVTCIDIVSGDIGDFPVLAHGFADALCYRLTTPELCSVVQSIETAMVLPNGKVVKTPHMTGKPVVIKTPDGVRESLCMDVEFIGVQPVVKIDLGDRMFFAGEHAHATIATHNIRFKP